MTVENNIKKNIKLAPHTTFRIGGPAKFFVEVKTTDELIEAVSWAKEKKLKYFILGGGSNILFDDNGYDGLVVKISNKKIELIERILPQRNFNNQFISQQPPQPPLSGGRRAFPHGNGGLLGDKVKLEFNQCAVNFNPSAKDKIFITADAGTNLSQLVKFSTDNSLTGLEWASGIYGTLGGAIFGNAGANSGCMADVIQEVEIFDGKKIKVLKNKDLNFKYRSSGIKKSDIIISAKLELKKGNKQESEKLAKQYLKQRQEKQPKGFCAGSIFKNPKSKKYISAGWLIEQCGLKGLKIGQAQISEKHANFIINLGKAKSSDVLALIEKVKKEVERKFRVRLKEELKIISSH